VDGTGVSGESLSVRQSGITLDDEILICAEPEYLILLRLYLSQEEYDAARR
jgi:hypothetical protein